MTNTSWDARPVAARRTVRSSNCVFNGTVVGTPVGGIVFLLHWRRDVFAKFKLAPPETWEQLVDVARQLNSTDFDGGASKFPGVPCGP